MKDILPNGPLDGSKLKDLRKPSMSQIIASVLMIVGAIVAALFLSDWWVLRIALVLLVANIWFKR